MPDLGHQSGIAKTSSKDKPAAALKTARRRSHERLPVEGEIFICCQDQQGAQRRFRARAIDSSRSGILVQTEVPVATGTVVYLQTPNFTVLGKATVRHCTQRGFRYRIGLYLPDPLLRGL